MIPPPTNGASFIGMDDTISTGNGIYLPSNGHPLFLCLDQVGDLVKRGLWAVGDISGNGVFGYSGRFLRNSAKVANPNPALATIGPAAGEFVVVTGIITSVNVNEKYLWSLVDSGHGVIFEGFGYGSEIQQLPYPIVIDDGFTADLTVNQGTTSTLAVAGLIGLAVKQSSFPAIVNQTIVEIFRCSCAKNGINAMQYPNITG